ncbi:MAG: aminomethyl-transferring glycine dehydrogenase [Bdellovibrionales bacterium]
MKDLEENSLRYNRKTEVTAMAEKIIIDSFSNRHIGPSASEIQDMLTTLNVDSLDALIRQCVPESIYDNSMNLDAPLTEASLLIKAKELARKNKVYKSYIGQGYYECITPSVILRNILENPGWYTAYTPYQSEISQGRMEALLNFQTMVCDLTGMELSNASLLDEGTAAAEAMVMAYNLNSRKSKSHRFVVDQHVFQQTKEVLQTRAAPLDIQLDFVDVANYDFDSEPAFGVLIQFPNAEGAVSDLNEWAKKVHASDALIVASADLLSLALFQPPGQWGADIVVGSTQRLGVPMGFGGPHAAFLATREEYKRNLPGRIIGVSKDSRGKNALRLALQTREQHIRREKATSNICTAQVLLAVMAGMYAVYHGPDGLKRISQRIHTLAQKFAEELSAMGWQIRHTQFFDTVFVELSDMGTRARLQQILEQHSINANFFNPEGVIVSFDETKMLDDMDILLSCFAKVKSEQGTAGRPFSVDSALYRQDECLKHPIFKQHHSETEMLRYISFLERKDIALNRSMIPLGSCTMKLNATTEMIPVTWPEFSSIHPFAPLEQAQGYIELINELSKDLAEITGYDSVSLQPNAGSQGEYAGLLVIRKYHESQGQGHRNICLIPQSAHGTNPASAAMAGMKVIVTKCDSQGNIDIDDLKQKAEQHKDHLAALMITYPSTHGVFEEEIKNVCNIIHDFGGQVYMDGANLNALVGVARPGQFGSDVSHLNLHKTFCIPHGGGGPGVGPIGVGKHLAPFLPHHSVVPDCGPKDGIGAVSAAPWGSASILPISWAYCKMMGQTGLTEATHVAILNANYIAQRLKDYYPILYTGKNDRVAHECIIDLRPFKAKTGVDVNDVAKRLMDYGFHSPTMSWPVPGTLMIEPTESESKAELDRFCEAMISIRKEIDQVDKGDYPQDNNPLVNAPHSADDLIEDTWNRPYSQKQAFYPLPWVQENKYWPPVNRVDNAYGDKNLLCACPPIESYEN